MEEWVEMCTGLDKGMYERKGDVPWQKGTGTDVDTVINLIRVTWLTRRYVNKGG
jgi:hypothetical protein